MYTAIMQKGKTWFEIPKKELKNLRILKTLVKLATNKQDKKDTAYIDMDKMSGKITLEAIANHMKIEQKVLIDRINYSTSSVNIEQLHNLNTIFNENKTFVCTHCGRIITDDYILCHKYGHMHWNCFVRQPLENYMKAKLRNRNEILDV